MPGDGLACAPFVGWVGMSGGVRVDGAVLTGVADSLETRAGLLRDSDTCVASPDAGRSTDEISAALSSLRESMGELATAIDGLAGRLHDAVEAYGGWDADQAGSAPTVTTGASGGSW